MTPKTLGQVISSNSNVDRSFADMTNALFASDKLVIDVP